MSGENMDEEQQRLKEAEGQRMKEVEEQRLKEAEEQRMKEVEEQRLKKAEEQRMKEAEEQSLKEAEEQRMKEVEEQKLKETEEQRIKEAEEQRMKEVEEHAQFAREHYPENFGSVYMLYINLKVNGEDVTAMVDSGAQITILTEATAERCGVLRLMDERYHGITSGVGTQKILGRIHMCPLEIQGCHYNVSMTILKHLGPDMILGLEFMKHYQCTIDLQKNALVIGTTGDVIPFLSEGELPECDRLHVQPKTVEKEHLSEALNKLTTDTGILGNVSTDSVSFHDADIECLMKYGCSRTQAQHELVQAGGNLEVALTYYLAKSLQQL